MTLVLILFHVSSDWNQLEMFNEVCGAWVVSFKLSSVLVYDQSSKQHYYTLKGQDISLCLKYLVGKSQHEIIG